MNNYEESNSKRIEDFMKKLDNGWSDLKKIRYIELCLSEMYNYNPKYAYGTFDNKNEILQQAVEYQFDENRSIDDLINSPYQICLSLSIIMKKLLMEAGIKKENIIMSGSEMIITIDNDGEPEIITVYAEKDLLPNKTKQRPVGIKEANSFMGASPEFLQRIETIDRELGFINSDGYNELKRVEKPNEVGNILQYGSDYITKVLGGNLSEVHLHQYYKLLLKTTKPGLKFEIFPLFDNNIENIKYVLITKENEEYGIYLYNDIEKRFEKTSKDKIKQMRAEGMQTTIETGKDNRLDEYLK